MNDVKTAIADMISAAENILLVTHINPDGDGLGTITALARAIRSAGKEASLLLPGEVPDRYDSMLFDEKIKSVSEFQAAAGAADLVIIADTCSLRQLDNFAPLLSSCKDKTVVIDHHVTGDEIGIVRWVDPSAAAAGIMAMELLDTLGWPLAKDVAEPLAIAILTDTGWLRFSNTDSRCLHAMARLIEAGIRPDVLYRRIYQSDRFEKLKLMGRVLESLQLHCDGRLAVLSLTRRDFEQTGARPDETENLVNEAMRIGTIEAAAILVDNGDEIRVSLRSREIVDVAQVAASLGGGGHARAAGLRLNGAIENAVDKIIAAISQKLP